MPILLNKLKMVEKKNKALLREYNTEEVHELAKKQNIKSTEEAQFKLKAN